MGALAVIPAILQTIFGIAGGVENSAQTAEDRKWIRDNFTTGMGNLDAARSNIIGSPAGKIPTGSSLSSILSALGGNTLDPSKPGPKQATGLYALADEFAKQYGGLKDESVAGANSLRDKQSQAYLDLAGREVQGLTNSLTGVEGDFKTLAKELNNAYGGRTSKLMDMLKGYGTQEKADVEQSYKNAQGAQARRLAMSGMGGTTAAISAMAGTERLKQAELARVNERLQKLGLDTYGAASKDQLTSRQTMGITGTELSRLNALGISDLSSRMNTQAVDQATALGQWAQGSNDIMTMNTLSAQQQAKLMPIQADLDMTRFQEGTRIGWQGAPDAVPLGTSIAAGIQPTLDYMAQQQALAQQRAAQKSAERSNMFGSLIGAGSNIAGSYLGAPKVTNYY